MNGIILYGSRYGAARQYAQALEEDRPPRRFLRRGKGLWPL